MSDYLHQALNLNKVLQFTPPPELNTQGLKFPSNWQQKLAAYWGINDSELAKHIGEKSTYPLKTQLIECLHVIYWRLNGDLDELTALSANERASLISQCIEDIQECSAGFHNRIHFVVGRFSQPINLEQLLYLVRKSLVLSVAAQLTSEIHATNYVTGIAAAGGLGVAPNFTEDPYKGELTSKAIQIALQNSFQQQFTPFKLPLLLSNQVRVLCESWGYHGQKTKGESYKLIEYKKIHEQIEQFLPDIKLDSVFLIDDECHIRDINWLVLQKAFFHRLKDAGFIISKGLTPKDLVEHIVQKVLLKVSEPLPPYQNNFALLKDYEELICYFPDYKDKPEFLFSFFNFDKLLEKNSEHNTILHLIGRNYPSFLNYLITHNKELSLPWGNLLLQNNKKKCNVLVDTACFQPGSLGLLLNFLTSSLSELGIELVRDLLLQKNEWDRNTLMQACCQPESVRLLLDFLTIHMQQLGIEVIKELLFKDKRNVLITGSILPESLGLLLNFLIKHKDSLGLEIIKSLLGNALTVIVRHSESLSLFLDFITRYKNELGFEFIQTLLLEKKGWRSQILIGTARNPSALRLLLGFLITHRGELGIKFIRVLLLQQNQSGRNVLMGASNFPESLRLLLNFLGTYKDELDIKVIQALLLQTSKGSKKTLTEMAKSQSLPLVLDFLVKYKNELGLEIIKILLLQKDAFKRNVLMVAVYYPLSLLQLLVFLTSYKDDLGIDLIKDLFFQNNIEDRNVLMEVVCDRLKSLALLESLALLLDFLIIHKDELGAETLKTLLLPTLPQLNSQTSDILGRYAKLLGDVEPEQLNVFFELIRNFPDRQSAMEILDKLGVPEQVILMLRQQPDLVFNYYFYNNNHERMASVMEAEQLAILMAVYKAKLDNQSCNAKQYLGEESATLFGKKRLTEEVKAYHLLKRAWQANGDIEILIRNEPALREGHLKVLAQQCMQCLLPKIHKVCGPP